MLQPEGSTFIKAAPVGSIEGHLGEVVQVGLRGAVDIVLVAKMLLAHLPQDGTQDIAAREASIIAAAGHTFRLNADNLAFLVGSKAVFDSGNGGALVYWMQRNHRYWFYARG